jgi:hypothetical protein
MQSPYIRPNQIASSLLSLRDRHKLFGPRLTQRHDQARRSSLVQLPVVGCNEARLLSAAPDPHIDNTQIGEGPKLLLGDIHRGAQGRLVILFGRTPAASVGNLDDDDHGVFSQSQDSNSGPGGGVVPRPDRSDALIESSASSIAVIDLGFPR